MSVGDIAELGAVTVNSAFDVDAFQAFSAASFRQVAGSGTTSFFGPLSTSAAAGVNVDGTSFEFDDTVTVALGDIDVDATGTVLFNGAVSTVEAANGKVTVTKVVCSRSPPPVT